MMKVGLEYTICYPCYCVIFSLMEGNHFTFLSYLHFNHGNGSRWISKLVTSSRFSFSTEFLLDLVEPDEALQFLPHARRSFLHPGKTKCEEQKREARKAYEEKCSMLGKRFCPKLATWVDFQQWEIGGGYESKRNPLPTQTPAPQMHTMRTHRTPLYTVPTLRTYRTPLYGSVTTKPAYRTPFYDSESVTRNAYAWPSLSIDHVDISIITLALPINLIKSHLMFLHLG